MPDAAWRAEIIDVSGLDGGSGLESGTVGCQSTRGAICESGKVLLLLLVEVERWHEGIAPSVVLGLEEDLLNDALFPVLEFALVGNIMIRVEEVQEILRSCICVEPHRVNVELSGFQQEGPLLRRSRWRSRQPVHGGR